MDISSLNEQNGQITLLRTSIDKGINYLQDHQFPNGEFVTYFTGDATINKWLRPDRSLFTTALICHSLSFIHNDKSEEIQLKSRLFLGGEISHYGLWNHFAKHHPFQKICPYDIDDTCCISILYKDKGIQFPNPSNIPLIIANKSKSGLFYTWFIFRWKHLGNIAFLNVIKVRFLRPIHNLIFWKSVEANPNDIDGVVNANVLNYLGDCSDTQKIIDFLISIIENEQEEDCDLWYRDKFIVYYFFTRNYFNGIHKLKPIVEPILKRCLAKVDNDGRIGGTILDTAWAICTFINIGYKGVELENAVKYLIKEQGENGSWPRWIAYWGGPKKTTGFGSEELTTAFCLEAIARYQKTLF